MILRLFCLALIITSLFSCEYFKDEPEELVSAIDGEQYQEDMKSDFNARKFTYLLDQGKADQVPYDGVLDMADSLTTEDSIWRARYMIGINLYNHFNYYNIGKSDYPKMGIVTFHFFMNHPKQFLELYNQMEIPDIDFWNLMLKQEIDFQTSQNGVTTDKIISLAQENCKHCDNDTYWLIEKIVNTAINDDSQIGKFEATNEL